MGLQDRKEGSSVEIIVQIVVLIMAVLSGLLGYGAEGDTRGTMCMIMSMFLFTLLMVWVGGVLK